VSALHYQVLDGVIEAIELAIAKRPETDVFALTELSLFTDLRIDFSKIDPSLDQLREGLAETKERHRLRGGPISRYR